MQMSWRERLQHEPALTDINRWPVIDSLALPVKKRRFFLRNRRIVAQALAGQSFAAVAAANQVHLSFVSQLLKRCLGGDESTPPPLTRALVPGTRLQVTGRRQPLPSLAQPRGARGAFHHLLGLVPGLKPALDGLIAAAVKRKAAGQNLTPQVFHAEFLRRLRDARWPEDTYPFTALRQGYESARQYFHRQVAQQQMPQAKPARVIRPLAPVRCAYEQVQIDEHCYDAHATVYLALNEQVVPLRLGRVTLMLAVDVATDTYLAYQLCLTQSPTQYDMLALLHQLHVPWSPLTLTTPGLTYAPGACFPTAAGEPFVRIGIGTVHLDNALTHLAHSVRDYLCEREGATLNLGLPAHPKSRNLVEHAFDLVARQAHRLPSTTGSHPHDPLREARKHHHHPPRLTLRALEEMLSVLLTEHNVRAQARLQGRTPLEVLRQDVAQRFVRCIPTEVMTGCDPLVQTATVTVRWRRHEHRRPHVNFEHLRYQGDALLDPSLVGQSIRVEFHINDIRVVKAYRTTGEYLGELRAPQTWQHYAHSVTTRRRIFQLTKQVRLTGHDMLGGYFAWHLAHRTLIKSALEMVRVYREFFPLDALTIAPPMSDGDEPVPHIRLRSTTTPTVPTWTPAFATTESV